MTTVPTVRGPVEAADLGRTLVHEHVFVLSPEHVANYGTDRWWDEEERVADAVARLEELRALGIDTILDPTVWGLGRYLPRVQRIAAQTSLNIVVATGLYTYDEVPFQYANRGPGTLLDGPRDPMVDDFVRDLTEGIADTGVRAAFLKCAVEAKGLTPGVERTLRACATAARETGAPITVHTSAAAQTGRLVVQVLREEGVDLTKVVIGHAGDSNDLDYLRELADAGCVLGMDRFGLDVYNSTEARVDTVAALAAQGYADRMGLAHDASCYIDWFPGEARDAVAAAMPNWNYTHLPQDVLPMLRERGVTGAQLDQMLVEVPRRYLSS